MKENGLVQMVHRLLILVRTVERRVVVVILTLKQEIQIIIAYAESDKLN